MLSMRDFSRGYEESGPVVLEWTGRHDVVSREQTHARPLPPHTPGSARQYALLFLAFMALHQAWWGSRGLGRLCTFLHSGPQGYAHCCIAPGAGPGATRGRREARTVPASRRVTPSRMGALWDAGWCAGAARCGSGSVRPRRRVAGANGRPARRRARPRGTPAGPG